MRAGTGLFTFERSFLRKRKLSPLAAFQRS